MSIQEYLRILRQRGWIIVLAAVVTAGSALVFSMFQPAVYRASIEVSIQPARPDLGLTQSAKWLLNSYTTVLWSKQYAQRVVDELLLLQGAEEIKGDVTFASDDNRMAIQIEADSTSRKTAEDIANTWALLLVAWRDEQNARQNKEDRVYAEIIDWASHRQIRPRKTINTAAGGVFGVAIGVVIVFALEWLEAGIVRDPRTLEQETGLTVIGLIPPA